LHHVVLRKLEGAKKMSGHSISYYEEQFKKQIMNALVGEQLVSLSQLLKDLIQENQEDYRNINYAYLNVKKELTGSRNHP